MTKLIALLPRPDFRCRVNGVATTSTVYALQVILGLSTAYLTIGQIIG